jgi:hypothetical protein
MTLFNLFKRPMFWCVKSSSAIRDAVGAVAPICLTQLCRNSQTSKCQWTLWCISQELLTLATLIRIRDTGFGKPEKKKFPKNGKRNKEKRRRGRGQRFDAIAHRQRELAHGTCLQRLSGLAIQSQYVLGPCTGSALVRTTDSFRRMCLILLTHGLNGVANALG